MRFAGSHWFLFAALAAVIAIGLGEGHGQDAGKKKGKQAQPKRADKAPDKNAHLPEPPATPVAQLKVAKGFQVELLYSVPKTEEGSWVNLCVDPKGRLIASDQNGGLYRITVPEIGSKDATKIEKIPVDIGEAQGLLWAFDSLYVVVNTAGKYPSGVYRVTDTDNNDMLDKVETLRTLEGRGEHGPHAVLLTPDKQNLYIVCGNGTKQTQFNRSRVPQLWGEDHLLPRMPDGRGFMRDVLGPGGCIYKIDPAGKEWELVSTGYRNEFDAAINREGELFTYDADMEWDFNTPWYRPTRVCHATSGSEWGWRNGAGKWPTYYADTLPPVVDVGPGSPTGIVFGYGAKFPARYQEALFICDWSYGKLYAVHFEPQGSSYTAKLEEFVTGTPLPLTDLVVRPQDGAMYFAIGGRKTKSGLYRVTYTGSESTEPSKLDQTVGKQDRELRRELESLHLQKDPRVIDKAWPHLASTDRFIRFAARVAIEHQDVKQWQDKALAEKDPQGAITALLALVRAAGTDPFHRKADLPVADSTLLGKIVTSLEKIDWQSLDGQQRNELLRVYAVAFNRLGPPSDDLKARTIARFDPAYPAATREQNAELANLLVYLQAPSAAEKTVLLLATAPTQEEQIEYARALRMLRAGWTPDLRESYFKWFHKAAGYKGGMSFVLFVENIKKDALTTLSDAEKDQLKPLLDAQPIQSAGPVAPPRPFVKEWKLDELTQLADAKLTGRNFDQGRKMFAAANCFGCHRFGNEGGSVGPDLSGAAGRFSRRDLLENIVDPSKVISDQYAAVRILTADGRIVIGRVVNLAGDNIKINTNMLDPTAVVDVDHRLVEEISPSPNSMMPNGLMNTLSEEEALDLVAYLLSRGDRSSPMFAK
ncbi:Cytochrome c [Anatilimnocola aggregata]|uniref:Cytochrome c n=1 Tax=Anatilimnocola aggregata TaxID=2528021 RepID=A0A517YC73_9BACT|nr:c-type cytochrome [Anatilimnocola aggregata]QDU27824.1 Cytochrome c [Anatilimnocola aggregata]